MKTAFQQLKKITSYTYQTTPALILDVDQHNYNHRSDV